MSNDLKILDDQSDDYFTDVYLRRQILEALTALAIRSNQDMSADDVIKLRRDIDHDFDAFISDIDSPTYREGFEILLSKYISLSIREAFKPLAADLLATKDAHLNLTALERLEQERYLFCLKDKPGLPIISKTYLELIDNTSRFIKQRLFVAEKRSIFPQATSATREAVMSPGLSIYLNENGLKIIDKLVSYYSGREPRYIGAMLYALQEMGMLKYRMLQIGDKDLAEAMKHTFNLPKLSHQHTGSGNNGWKRLYEEPLQKHRTAIDREISTIKTFL